MYGFPLSSLLPIFRCHPTFSVNEYWPHFWWISYYYILVCVSIINKWMINILKQQSHCHGGISKSLFVPTKVYIYTSNEDGVKKKSYDLVLFLAHATVHCTRTHALALWYIYIYIWYICGIRHTHNAHLYIRIVYLYVVCGIHSLLSCALRQCHLYI